MDLARLHRLALEGDASAAAQRLAHARRHNDEAWLPDLLISWSSTPIDVQRERVACLLPRILSQRDLPSLQTLTRLWIDVEGDHHDLKKVIKDAATLDTHELLHPLLYAWAMRGGPMTFQQLDRDPDDPDDDTFGLLELIEDLNTTPIHLIAPVRTLLQWNPQRARLFLCDCAERTLAPFEARFPDDRRPHTAIAMARRFARGEVTKTQRLQADRDATDAASEAGGFSGSPWAAAWIAHGDPVSCHTVLNNALSSCEDPDAERDWQADHLLAYLFGDA